MIKRYKAIANTSITNMYTSGLITRATGSNNGKSDVHPLFSIFAQQSSASSELSRILYKFPTETIAIDRAAGTIPASGSCDFYLRLFNAPHHETNPVDFTISIQSVSRSWSEGYGKNIDEGSDSGYANWEKAMSSSAGITSWSNSGGDFHVNPSYSASFVNGDEDLEKEITGLVEEHVASEKSNYGICVRLDPSIETAQSSSYIKKFFGRGSEFFFKVPTIEARWDDSRRDDRSKFYASSSLYTAADNTNTIFLYNFARGALASIPDASTAIYLLAFDDPKSGSQLTQTAITGGQTSTDGIYSASFALATTSSYIYDRWYTSGSVSEVTYIHTGSINVEPVLASNANQLSKYVTSIPNLKTSYSDEETERIRLSIRSKDWCPSIFVKASNEVESEIIDDSYYKIYRTTDELDVISYGTGSTNHTRLSRDISGSYFDLDMSLLEPGYAYGIKLVYKLDNKYREQKEVFKFRVEE